MNQATKNHETASAKKAIFPWVVIFIVATILFVLNFFEFQLNEQFNLNPGIKNLCNLALPVLTIFVLSLWFLIKRRFRRDSGTALGILALASPILFFTFFQPVVGGDAELLRFDSRFWKSEKNLESIELVSTELSLAVTTPFDFPQFLGPQRNATVNNVTLANWSSEKPKELWKQPIGEGWSSFAAVNGLAVTQEQRADQECVVCYEIETGKSVWVYSAQRRHEDTMAMGKVGPRATPTIVNGKVFTTSATGVLDCLDGKTGELLWSADIASLVGIDQLPKTNSSGLMYTEEASNMAWGRSSSPLVIGNKVIVPGGGATTDTVDVETGEFTDSESKAATLIAFDIETGKEIWRGGKRMVAYGSPSLMSLAGRDQILLVTENKAVGHDPETGEELWAVDQAGTSNADANCSQVTKVSENSFLLSKGYNKGGALFNINQSDNGFEILEPKSDPRVLKTKFTNPVIYDGHFYSLSDGYLECSQTKDLKRKWKRRDRFGNGQLLLVGDKLLVHSDAGELFLIAANPDEYTELGRIKTIKGICWNTICLYGDKVLLRSDQEAACYQLPMESELNNGNK